MAAIGRGILDLERVGGMLCIDFVNTMGWRGRALSNEWLKTPADLFLWARSCHILSQDTFDRASLMAESDAAGDLLEKAHSFREVLYCIFSAIAAKQRPCDADITTLNNGLPAALSRLRLRPSGTGEQWEWHGDDVAIEEILLPIVRSAMELLTSPRISRLKECANEGCAWVFLDGSKNRSRRWCDMRDCGNRAKAKRHYHRAKST
ncbi:MAG: hypothetical protein HOH43_08960 [Candidatus Latescibacteria bacterium]|nr:hypothetical protein [Candidatus Latescibacterota bacterium]